MNKTASEAIKIALAEDGYFGKKFGTDNLDIKDAPNGTGEYTKYARDLYQAGFYNGSKQGYDGHCTVFVDWVLWQLDGCYNKSDRDNATCLNPVNTCGAGAAYNAGCYDFYGLLDSTPRVGDKVFFCKMNKDGTVGNAYHVGLVVAINGDTLTTVEGNTIDDQGRDNAYCKKTRKISKNMVFGHPRYDAEQETSEVDQVKAELEEKIKEVQRLELELVSEKQKRAATIEKVLTLYNELKGED